MRLAEETLRTRHRSKEPVRNPLGGAIQCSFPQLLPLQSGLTVTTPCAPYQNQVLPPAMGANTDPESLQPLLDDSGCADGA
jgi:hypothetical protein